jgi:hypothetical protein
MHEPQILAGIFRAAVVFVVKVKFQVRVGQGVYHIFPKLTSHETSPEGSARLRAAGIPTYPLSLPNNLGVPVNWATVQGSTVCLREYRCAPMDLTIHISTQSYPRRSWRGSYLPGMDKVRHACRTSPRLDKCCKYSSLSQMNQWSGVSVKDGSLPGLSEGCEQMFA